MPTLVTEDLAPGMVLDQDVKDRSGRLLVRSGSELTERSLRVLRTWGVVEVRVLEDEQTRERQAVDQAHPLADGQRPLELPAVGQDHRQCAPIHFRRHIGCHGHGRPAAHAAK